MNKMILNSFSFLKAVRKIEMVPLIINYANNIINILNVTKKGYYKYYSIL